MTVRRVVLAAAVTAAWPAHAMDLSSPDITSGARFALVQVNTRCGGQNRSPAIVWNGAPPLTKSFALTLYDPDAGNGRGFWHWLIFDIPARTSELAADAANRTGLPRESVQAKNDFGRTGYDGACPPPGSGTHHYKFTLYALDDATIPFDSSATGSALTAYLGSHALAQAALLAVYSR